MPENDCYSTDKWCEMKKTIPFLVLITLLASCKEEVVKKPDNLIKKEVMVDVIYDLFLMEAIKHQNPNSLEAHKINPTEYIYKKHKIDSIQFTLNNTYYASDYKEYKKIYAQINSRLETSMAMVESSIKNEKTKALLLKKAKQKLKAKKETYSLAKTKKKKLGL